MRLTVGDVAALVISGSFGFLLGEAKGAAWGLLASGLVLLGAAIVWRLKWGGDASE